MADNKELKRLSRSELLELLIAQTKKNEKLTEQLDEAKQKLEDRSMAVAEAGSLAEASLQVGGVFEAAQQAIDLYRENVTARCRQEEKDAKKHALAYVRKALTVLSSAAQTIEHAGGDASEVRRLAQELIGKYGKKSAEHAGEADPLAESTPESTPQTETEAAEKKPEQA